jgi:U2 small nuclear ribonucleoprotein A'
LTILQHYRSYLIWLIPSIRFLDFRRVKDVEREQAKALLGTADAPTELASKIKGVKSRTFDPSSTDVNGKAAIPRKGVRTKLTEAEKKRVERLIQNAKSFQEIERIEKDLAEGRIPAGAADVDRMVS